MKRYVVIAGVNGAGKSTLFSVVSYFKDMEKINLDEVVREIGDWRNVSDVITAGKMVVERVNSYFSEGVSFSQETTLCGRSILRNIEKAKDIGYNIELHYVGLESADLAKERVSYRVANGGHGISDEDIERRYDESFENFKKVISLCDLVAVYDNTESLRRFAIYKNGRKVRLSSNVPEWYKKLSI